MRGLVYLEWCYARNNFNAIRRSPTRLLLWSAYIAWLVFLSVGRFAHVAPRTAPALGVTHAAAISIAGGFILLTGVSIVLGGVGRFAVFRSAAEAVLMCDAGLRPITIAIWLQLRKSVAGFRSLGAFSYTFLIFAPVHAGLFGTLRAYVATLCVLAVPQTAALPAFLLARGRGRIPVLIAGSLFAALGIVYAIGGLGGSHLSGPLLRTTHFDVALLVKAALLAEPVAFVIPLLLVATFVCIVALRGNDALPELYAASNMMLARQRRAGAKRLEGRPARRSSKAVASARVPAGSLAIVWKDWVALRRASGGIVNRIAGPSLWICAGIAAAALTQYFGDRTPLGAFESIVGLRIVFWTPIAAAAGLAAELSQPLFWLSTDSLRTRLAAWTVAGAWPAAIAMGLAAAAAALVLGLPVLALCCVPFTALSVCAFKALGIGLYAVFPNPIDAGGPTLLLRLAASIAYLVPAGLVAALAAIFHAGELGTLTAFALTLGVQGWIVLEFVALRFSEYGASLATISRAT